MAAAKHLVGPPPLVVCTVVCAPSAATKSKVLTARAHPWLGTSRDQHQVRPRLVQPGLHGLSGQQQPMGGRLARHLSAWHDLVNVERRQLPKELELCRWLPRVQRLGKSQPWRLHHQRLHGRVRMLGIASRPDTPHRRQPGSLPTPNGPGEPPLCKTSASSSTKPVHVCQQLLREGRPVNYTALDEIVCICLTACR